MSHVYVACHMCNITCTATHATCQRTATNHSFHVLQLEEDHEFHSDDTDIICPDVPDTAIEVRGHMAELEKPVLRRNVAARVIAIRTMPKELVQPVIQVDSGILS